MESDQTIWVATHREFFDALVKFAKRVGENEGLHFEYEDELDDPCYVSVSDDLIENPAYEFEVLNINTECYDPCEACGDSACSYTATVRIGPHLYEHSYGEGCTHVYNHGLKKIDDYQKED